MAEVIRHTGAKTKRDAIITAVGEFNRRRRMEELAERLHGSCPDFMTQADLQQSREDRKWETSR